MKVKKNYEDKLELEIQSTCSPSCLVKERFVENVVKWTR